MPGYDIKTDKIFGCKKYTKEWWHERGHQILHNNEKWQEIETYNEIIFLGCIASLIIGNRYISGFLFLIFLFVMITDELVATIYCHKNKSKWIKQ